MLDSSDGDWRMCCLPLMALAKKEHTCKPFWLWLFGKALWHAIHNNIRTLLGHPLQSCLKKTHLDEKKT